MKTLAIDFDGVIHRYSKGWQRGDIYDPPMEGAMESLIRLGAHYKIVVFTARENTQTVQAWMVSHLQGYPGGDTFQFEVSRTKPMAVAYIDDRGIRFTSWADILKYFH